MESKEGKLSQANRKHFVTPKTLLAPENFLSCFFCFFFYPTISLEFGTIVIFSEIRNVIVECYFA